MCGQKFIFGILILREIEVLNRKKCQIIVTGEMGEKFILTWHTFLSHGQEVFKNLMENQEFTDVTLISDDHHQYRVHKFILSACSTVFRKIVSNPHNSSIYLRGIYHEELESILQFMYLGEATFYHKNMNKFLNVAKELDIKEIGDEECVSLNDTQSFEQDDLESSDEIHGNDHIKSSRITSQLANDTSYSLNHAEKKQFQCKQCKFQATDLIQYRYHVQTMHEGIEYCEKCDYQTIQPRNLQRHIQ